MKKALKIWLVAIFLSVVFYSVVCAADTEGYQSAYTETEKNTLDNLKEEVNWMLVYLKKVEKFSDYDSADFVAAIQSNNGRIVSMELEDDADFHFRIPVINREYDEFLDKIPPGNFLIKTVLAGNTLEDKADEDENDRYPLFACVSQEVFKRENVKNKISLRFLPVGSPARIVVEKFPNTTSGGVDGSLEYDFGDAVCQWDVRSWGSWSDNDNLESEVFVPWGAKNLKISHFGNDGTVYQYGFSSNFSGESVIPEYNPLSETVKVELDVSFVHNYDD